MKKITKWLACFLALAMSLFVFASCDETKQSGSVGNGGSSGTGEKGTVTGVELLYNGQAVENDVLTITYDDAVGASNEYEFTVNIVKTGEVDEVEEMVFWTSDNAAVAQLTDNGNSAKVTLTGTAGDVEIKVWSLLYSDTIFDSVTLKIEIPARPMANIDALAVYTLEAEDADLSKCVYGGTKADGTIVETTTSASTGGKYDASGGKVIGNLNKQGNIISFCVTSEKPAKAQLILMLAAGTYRSSDGSNMSIDFENVAKTTVNDVEVQTNVKFNVHTSDTWYKYEEYSAESEITLNEGVNYIKFEVKTNASFNSNTQMPNMDYIKLNVVEYDGQKPASSVDSVTIKENGATAEDKTVAYKAATPTLTYTADVQVSGELSTDVTWTSSDETVATVSNGVVTLQGKTGTFTLRATSVADTTRSHSITISVVVPHANVTSAGTYRMEAETAVMNNAKSETPSKYYIYTPDTEYSEAVQGSASGGKNSSMSSLNSSITFNVWSDSACEVTLKFCAAPSANNKSQDYSYSFDDVVGIKVNGVAPTAETGITVNVPTKSVTDATSVGCYFYYTEYTSATKLSLQEGLNTIVFTTLTNGYTNLRTPNFDYFELVLAE